MQATSASPTRAGPPCRPPSRHNPNLALKRLYSVELAPFDDALPEHVVRYNSQYGNETVLSYYRDRAARRLHTRVAAVALLRAAWRRGAGKAAGGVPTPPALRRAGALAALLQLRRVCRVRGDVEAVEPFGRAVVEYLGGSA